MFTEAIIKLTSICNLDCSYCYMFNLADRTYTRVPSLMSIEVIDACLDKIARHIDEHQLRSFILTLHGGEPTLWPVARFEHLFSGIAAQRRRGRNIEVHLQTNAYKTLPIELLRLFSEAGVVLGVSLDGPREINDRYRITRGGAGSYDLVVANVHGILESGFGHLLGGFLSVMQTQTEPERYLDWVQSLPITRVDLIWPIEFNHDKPPWTSSGEQQYARAPRYGSWLGRLFRAWCERDDPSIEIRLFDSAVKFWLRQRMGLPNELLATDDFAVGSMSQFVVNTDGRIEYPDYLRNSSDGSCHTAYSVQKHELSEAARDPIFAQLLRLGELTPSECAGCLHVETCGGGFLPGRTSRVSAVDTRRSVLCHDHLVFFDTVDAVLRRYRLPMSDTLPGGAAPPPAVVSP
jgi:uncharacterized protein